MRRGRRATLAAAALAMPAAAGASETVTYSYDALGRLVSVSTSGGPNAGQVMGTSFDPAGNRTNYNVTGAGAALLGGSGTGDSGSLDPDGTGDGDSSLPDGDAGGEGPAEAEPPADEGDGSEGANDSSPPDDGSGEDGAEGDPAAEEPSVGAR